MFILYTLSIYNLPFTMVCLLCVSYYLSLVIAILDRRRINTGSQHLSGRYEGFPNASPTSLLPPPLIPSLNFLLLPPVLSCSVLPLK